MSSDESMAGKEVSEKLKSSIQNTITAAQTSIDGDQLQDPKMFDGKVRELYTKVTFEPRVDRKAYKPETPGRRLKRRIFSEAVGEKQHAEIPEMATSPSRPSGRNRALKRRKINDPVIVIGESNEREMKSSHEDNRRSVSVLNAPPRKRKREYNASSQEFINPKKQKGKPELKSVWQAKRDERENDEYTSMYSSGLASVSPHSRSNPPSRPVSHSRPDSLHRKTRKKQKPPSAWDGSKCIKVWVGEEYHFSPVHFNHSDRVSFATLPQRGEIRMGLKRCQPNELYSPTTLSFVLRRFTKQQLDFDYIAFGQNQTHRILIECYPEINQESVKERAFYELRKPEKINKKELRKRLTAYFGKKPHKALIKNAVSTWRSTSHHEKVLAS